MSREVLGYKRDLELDCVQGLDVNMKGRNVCDLRPRVALLLTERLARRSSVVHRTGSFEIPEDTMNATRHQNLELGAVSKSKV